LLKANKSSDFVALWYELLCSKSVAALRCGAPEEHSIFPAVAAPRDKGLVSRRGVLPIPSFELGRWGVEYRITFIDNSVAFLKKYGIILDIFFHFPYFIFIFLPHFLPAFGGHFIFPI
jgi:hypothetical protein